MAKYIDREALIEWLKRIPLIDLSDGRGLCRVIMEDDFKKAIKKMPKGIIAEVSPARHGKWEEAIEPLGWHKVIVASCSVCGDSWVLDEFTIDEYAKWHQYCPSCGAKMDGYIRMPDTEFASDEE